MREALARLDAGDQEILRLVSWDGLAPAQAGMVLGCSPERHACGCIALVAGWRKSWRSDRLAADRGAMRSQSNQGFHNDRD